MTDAQFLRALALGVLLGCLAAYLWGAVRRIAKDERRET